MNSVQKQSRLIEKTKARIARKLGLKRDEAFERAWALAWREAHGLGITGVENYFLELVDILR